MNINRSYLTLVFIFFVSCTSFTNSNIVEVSKEKYLICKSSYIAFSNKTFFEAVDVTETEPIDNCLLVFKDTSEITMAISHYALYNKPIEEEIRGIQKITKVQGGANKFTKVQEESYHNNKYYTYSGYRSFPNVEEKLFSKVFILRLSSSSPYAMLTINFSFSFLNEADKIGKLDSINALMQTFEYKQG